ncbi:MAG: c-type cytochrome [Pseudomonadota bacterium]
MFKYNKNLYIAINAILSILILIYIIDNKINAYINNVYDNDNIYTKSISNISIQKSTSKTISSDQIKELIDNGNINNGKKLIKQCITCHNLTEKKHYIGPHLVNIINRPQGSKELDYNFSKTLKNSNNIWSEEELFRFIYAPKTYLPNTKMIFFGVKNYDDIGDIIQYLKHINQSNSTK